MPFDLIIFDCDGVLVDSEPLAMRVLLEVIAEQGIEIDRGTAFQSYLGRSLASISESLNQSHGAHLSEASLSGMPTSSASRSPAAGQRVVGCRTAWEKASLTRPPCARMVTRKWW